MSYRTRFLILNQPLVGQESKLTNIKPQNIYRAGQAPNWIPKNDDSNSDDSDSEKLASSYNISNKLEPGQNPTFVDVLKKRTDDTGHAITNYKLMNRYGITDKCKKNKKTVNYQSSQTSIPKKQQANDVQSEEEDFDFDLEDMSVPSMLSNNNIQNSNEHIFQIRNQLKTEMKLKQNEQKLDIKDIPTNNKIKENIEQPKEEKIKTPEIEIESNDISDESINNSNDESSSEYGTDDENEMNGKLVFLNAEKRHQLYSSMVHSSKHKNMQTMDEEYALYEEDQHVRKQEMVIEAREEVIQYVRHFEEEERERIKKNDGNCSDASMVDDTDEYVDELQLNEAIAKWHLREQKRFERDTKVRNEIIEEKEILLKRRSMTDAQIMKDNERLGIKQPIAMEDKKKMKFLQKYYHSGVFYRDNTIVDEQILKQNFLQPTGKDKWVNYENLPQIMQKKDFGKMSQTKWTHLAAEDTTDKSDYRFKHRAHGRERVIRRGGESYNHKHDKYMKNDDTHPEYQHNNHEKYRNKRDTFHSRDNYKHRSAKKRKQRG